MSLNYWPFWIGGIIGTVLLDIDHLIYVFFLNTNELTSQRVNFLLKKKEISRIITLLHETREERKNLVFHTLFFQAVLFVLTFLIISSSTSIFVRGIVLASCLHLSVDQLADFFDMKHLGNWGKISIVEFGSHKSALYILASFLLILIMGFLM